MFSGLVEEVGTILQIVSNADGRRLRISAEQITPELKLGDSVSVSGVCLTVVEFDIKTFSVEATHQTLRCTKLGQLQSGHKVNLERALKLSDRLGGHLVTGHIDGLGRVTSIKTEGFSNLVTIAAPSEYAAYFVEKGSVALDGVSLTVAALPETGAAQDILFTVALIPHTMDVTTIGNLKVGDAVNIEVDLIAKYVARWLGPTVSANLKNAGLSLSFLSEHGYT
jgi:riboflavin synthase